MNESFSTHYSQHTRYLAGRLVRIESLLDRTNRQLSRLFNWRLAVALIAFSSGLIIASGPQFKNWGFIFITSSLLFIYLVFRSRNIRRWQASLIAWKNHCVRNLSRISGKMPTGLSSPHLEALNSENQILARDLHILGDNSLFGLIDETFSSGGKSKLLRLLLDPLSNIQDIKERQDKLKLLSKNYWSLARFFFRGQSGQLPPDSSRLKSELDRSLVGSGFHRNLILHCLLYPLSAFLFAMWTTGQISFSGPLTIGIYFLFSLATLGQAARGFTQGEVLSHDLESLLPVFDWLESKENLSRELAPMTFRLKPAARLKRVRWILSCLSIQAHPLVFLAVNALFPWTYLWTWRLEKWRLRYFEDFKASLHEIENLEALGSLALFHHYQTPIFPTFQSDVRIDAKHLFHPLIPRNKVVANDFQMSTSTRLCLITGSNMSGKSTFLRTIGLNQHLAMIGCPIFAEKFETFCGPVLTCLQIKDSLEDGYSSFYYEVKRVKLVIDQASAGISFFYLVDEIFRGTNNRERLLGSQAVIRKLLSSPQALGLITTHDLELTHLAEEFKTLQNGHFRDEIRVEESGLHFSYQYHLGPCPTTNALKIMAAEGLPVPI